MNEELPRFLTPAQAANVLQFSEQYIRKHARELGAIKIGTRLRFPRGVIISLSETGKLPDAWQDADPEPQPTNAQPAHGQYAGAKMGNKKKNAATPSKRPTNARKKSQSAFEKDFPEYAHLVRSQNSRPNGGIGTSPPAA